MDKLNEIIIKEQNLFFVQIAESWFKLLGWFLIIAVFAYLGDTTKILELEIIRYLSYFIFLGYLFAKIYLVFTSSFLQKRYAFFSNPKKVLIVSLILWFLLMIFFGFVVALSSKFLYYVGCA